MASLSESELISKLYPKIQKCLQIEGDPSFSYSRYWDHSIPQYTVNYDNIINQIQYFESKCKNFYLSGNYRNGIALAIALVTSNYPFDYLSILTSALQSIRSTHLPFIN